MWPFAPKPRVAPPVCQEPDLTALGALRQRLARLIREVNGTTERETLAAGSALARLVEIGRAYVAEVGEVLDRKVTGDGAELTRAVRAQGARVRSDLERVTSSLDEHCAEVSAATAHADQISTAAGNIAHLATQARTLALNARIEAARVGDHGFAVIAQEMKRLSDAIADANATINQLASGLSATLPALRTRSAALGADTAALAADLRTDLTNVESQLETLQGEVRRALDGADRTVQAMVAASHDALSHLQFQDVAAQQLLSSDALVRDAQLALMSPDRHDEVAPAVATRAVTTDRVAGEVALF